MAHESGVLKIERLDDGRQSVGIAVRVVAGGGWAGPARAAPGVSDDPEALLREEKHLPVPGIRVQRPAVREGDDRALAPVLVIDIRAVPGLDHAHGWVSFSGVPFIEVAAGFHSIRPHPSSSMSGECIEAASKTLRRY